MTIRAAAAACLCLLVICGPGDRAAGGDNERSGIAVILRGVDHYRVADPLAEAVRVVISYRGEPYSAAYVQGISGMAFRLAGPCPCAPTCSAPMEPEGLVRLFGYEAERFPLGEKEAEVQARLPEMLRRVKEEIHAGRPVIVWHAFTTAEFDVVCGFDDEKGEGLKALGDKTLVKYHDRCTFVRLPYEKGSETAKLWNVSSTPMLILCDPSKEDPAKQTIERLSGKKSPRELKAAIARALKKVEGVKAAAK